MITFRLRECRERAGMSRRELAGLVGAHPMLIGKYERGQNCPSLSRAADIAIALGCSLDELAGIEQTADEQPGR